MRIRNKIALGLSILSLCLASFFAPDYLDKLHQREEVRTEFASRNLDLGKLQRAYGLRDFFIKTPCDDNLRDLTLDAQRLGLLGKFISEEEVNTEYDTQCELKREVDSYQFDSQILKQYPGDWDKVILGEVEQIGMYASFGGDITNLPKNSRDILEIYSEYCAVTGDGWRDGDVWRLSNDVDSAIKRRWVGHDEIYFNLLKRLRARSSGLEACAGDHPETIRAQSCARYRWDLDTLHLNLNSARVEVGKSYQALEHPFVPEHPLL